MHCFKETFQAIGLTHLFPVSQCGFNCCINAIFLPTELMLGFGVFLLLECDEINDKYRIFHGRTCSVLRNSHADNKGIVLLLMTL